MNKQCARLVLKTSSLSTSDLDTNFTKASFNNIDLRTVLGNNMFNEYDTFNLSLKSITSSVGGPATGETTQFGLGLDDLTVNIYLEGLPFINQTYVVGKQNTTEVLLTTFIFKRDQSASLYLTDNYITFSKYQQSCDLKFRYENLNTGSLPDTTGKFPDVVYIFEIYPVGEPKSINQIMNQRIV